MERNFRWTFLPLSEAGRDESKGLFLTSAAARRLGLGQDREVVLRTPSDAVTLRVSMFDRHRQSPTTPPRQGEGLEGEALYLAPRLLRRLALPPGRPLRMERGPGGELLPGPFVGIFCQRYPGPWRYGPQTRFFRRLIELGRTMGMFVYVFETGDVDRRSGTIAGTTWRPGRGWVRLPCPLPHVFYDRGMVTDSVMRIHRWLRLRGVQQFNGYVGSKLWVYRLLADHPPLARYIPPTTVLRRTRDLTAMIREHGTVYVKSAGGGKGIGIWIVSGHPRGGYTYRFTDSRTRIHRGATKDAGDIVRRLLAAPRQPWLIQPRLDLLRRGDRIFDVRVLVQRDERGELTVTGTGARVGRKGSFISNIHGGGDARPLPPLLQEGLGLTKDAAEAMQRDIEGISLAAARVIDGAVRRTGTVGELGIDIAVDTRGRLWFLEANSRTGRNVFPMAGMYGAAQAAMERPLQYAAYVAGFSPSSASS